MDYLNSNLILSLDAKPYRHSRLELFDKCIMLSGMTAKVAERRSGHTG